MKITDQQITYICEKVLRNLKEKNLVELKSSEQNIIKCLVDAFKNNLRQEADIEKEAKKILAQHQQQIDSGAVNYNKLFLMTKKKIAQEKGFVL